MLSHSNFSQKTQNKKAQNSKNITRTQMVETFTPILARLCFKCRGAKCLFTSFPFPLKSETDLSKLSSHFLVVELLLCSPLSHYCVQTLRTVLFTHPWLSVAQHGGCFCSSGLTNLWYLNKNAMCLSFPHVLLVTWAREVLWSSTYDWCLQMITAFVTAFDTWLLKLELIWGGKATCLLRNPYWLPHWLLLKHS